MLELLSLHVPKTAGTSFRKVLTQVYGSENILWDYSPHSTPPYDPSPQIRVIHGHIKAERYRDRFPDAKRIIWLRHPLFRLLSEYCFIHFHPDPANALHNQVVNENLSLAEYASLPAAQNVMSQQVRGAKLADFYFVGLQEFYRDDLMELAKQLNWPTVEVSVENSGPNPEYSRYLSDLLGNPTLMNQIAQLNEDDMGLYQKALKLRAQRRNESPIIQHTLAECNRSQFLMQRIQQDLSLSQAILNQDRFWWDQRQGKAQALALSYVNKRNTAGFIQDFAFDPPIQTDAADRGIFSIKGWVLGEKFPVRSVWVTCAARVIAESPVGLYRADVAGKYPQAGSENSGFRLNIGLMNMPIKTKLAIQAVLADETAITIAFLQPTT